MDMTLLRKWFFFLIIFFLLYNSASSQQFNLDSVKFQMIDDWTRAKAYTLTYIYAFPSDKFEFKPVENINSFSGQMIHLAVTSSFLVFMATDKTPPEFTFADIDKRANSHSKDSVLFYVSKSYDYCINAIKSLDISHFGHHKKISKFVKTRYELLLNAFEHQTHHRGQTTIYLRLQGIVPPEADLF